MVKLVSSQKEPLQMQCGNMVIKFGQPLRHSVVVGVFGLKSELKILGSQISHKAASSAREPSISRYGVQGLASIGNQANRLLALLEKIAIRCRCQWGAIRSSNKIVVQE